MNFLKNYLLTALSQIELFVRQIFSLSCISLSDNSFPKISIIIVVHNGLPYLKDCLVSLQKTTYKNFEIVVVDNLSDKATKIYLQRQLEKNSSQL